MQQTPEWAHEDTEPLRTSEESGPSALKSKNPWLYWSFKAITMGLSFLMFATALVSLSDVNSITSMGRIFVAFYMLFFSLLLFVFEFIQVYRVEYIDMMLQRNFGFLFSAKGKALYIIFIAFLCFGLQDPATMSFVTGSLLALFGGANFIIYLQNPEYFE